MHPDGTRVYVANEMGDTITVIDALTNTVVAHGARRIRADRGDRPPERIARLRGERLLADLGPGPGRD